MIHIQSKNPTIDAIRLHQIKSSRKYIGCNFVRVEGLIVIELKSGRLLTTCEPGTYTMAENYYFIAPLLTALVKLGVIKLSDMNEHLETVKKLAALKRCIEDMRLVKHLDKKYGWKTNFKGHPHG
jgi:hypothetical protein